MKRNKMLAITVVCLIFTMTLFGGCNSQPSGGKEETQATDQRNEDTAASAEPKSAAPAKITYWMPLLGDVVNFAKSHEELPFWQELQKRLNIDIEFQHPPVGMEKEQFKLLF